MVLIPPFKYLLNSFRSEMVASQMQCLHRLKSKCSISIVDNVSILRVFFPFVLAIT